MQVSSHSITLEAALRDVGSTDPRVRAAAADALGDVEDDDARRAAVPALLPLLADPRYEVRCSAALALGDLKDGRAVDALVTCLDDDSSEVRQSAAIALGRIGDPRAFEALVAALDVGQADLRFQAALSLAEIDPARAYDPLIRAVKDDDAEVRQNVAAALALVGDGRAAGWLVDLLSDARRRTRFEAACALASFGDKRATVPLTEFVDPRDLDDELAWRAIEHLESLGDARAVPGLGQLVRRRLAPRILRVRAACALLALDANDEGAAEARAVLDKAARAWRADVRGLAEECRSRLAACRR